MQKQVKDLKPGDKLTFIKDVISASGHSMASKDQTVTVRAIHKSEGYASKYPPYYVEPEIIWVTLLELPGTYTLKMFN